MVTTKQEKNLIQDTFQTYFRVIGGTWNIRKDGVIDVRGSVELKKKITGGKLPVKFGTVTVDVDFPETGLTTMENFPSSCQELYIPHNQISSWDHCPQTTMISASYNQFKNLQGIPPTVKTLWITNNPLENIQDIPPLKFIRISFNPRLGMLPALRCQGVKILSSFYSDDTKSEILQDILEKYCGTNNPGDVLRCASELTEHGLEGNAEW